jgi:KDO2-lipid IV(A) lauroyltransferase
VRQAIVYQVYRVLAALFGLLPEPVVRRLGRGLGKAATLVARDRFAMAMRHQTRVQGEGVDARRAAREVFAQYGRYWTETFWVRPRRSASILDRTTLVGIQHLHAARDSGRGIVLALPHCGNWEIAGLRAAAEDTRVLAVAEALSNERIVQWFIDMRASMEIDIVIARRGGSVTRALIERLRSGGTIALLCDRDLSGRGVPVTLFGEETTMPAGPVALADRTGAVLLPVGTYFEDGPGHQFEVHPALQIPDAATTEERVRLGTQALAGVVEKIIRKAPEQWHLILPNWPSDREAADREEGE